MMNQMINRLIRRRREKKNVLTCVVMVKGLLFEVDFFEVEEECFCASQSQRRQKKNRTVLRLLAVEVLKHCSPPI